MIINGPPADMAFDLLRAILEPARPERGRVLALTGPMGWRELTEPNGHGLMGGRAYQLSASGDLACNIIACYTRDWTTSPVGAGRQPTAVAAAGAFLIPMDAVVFHRTWPEDERIRVFVCAENVGANGTANCRIHGLAPGSDI